MTETKASCPPKNELVNYLLGNLTEEKVSLFESHFEGCNICEETIRGLSVSDTLSHLVEGVNSQEVETIVPDRNFVDKLVRQIQDQTKHSSNANRELYQRASEVIRLIQPTEKVEALGEIGHYQIDELVGAGSTGVVFRATDLKLQRSVALKVLRPSLGHSARQRFVSEAQSAASIEHPSVVTIYEVGDDDELTFIAMQWIDGETLEDRLDKITYVPEDQLKQIVEQIASGLDAAHQNNLIHRDIKPANIWLTANNDQVKILDFGLARIADDDPHLTSTGMLAGTPNYMSPEQSKGLELDARSDLFSLGCLMYRASTGKLPFGASGILATLQSIQNHQPSAPCQLNPAISQDFSDLTMGLLNKQPANRPGNASLIESAMKLKRKKWPFAITEPQQPTKKSNPIAKTQSAPSRFGWIAAIVAIGLIGWGWSVFGQQIIRIATDHGQLVIETDEEDLQVEILSDNETVKVINTWAEQSVNLKSGEYEIKPKNKEGASIEYQVSDNNFILNRGGKQIVSIKIAETKSIVGGNKTDLGPELTYEGRTFDSWTKTLSRERSKKNVAKGLEAIVELARGSKERQTQAIEVIRPWVRNFGHDIHVNKDDWLNIFNAAFSKLPVEHLVDFVLEELNHGTTESRKQLVWFTTMGSVYVETPSKMIVQQNELRRRIKKIVDAGCQAMIDNPQDGKTIRLVMENAIATSFAQRQGSSSENPNGSQKLEHFEDFLHEKILASTNFTSLVFLATHLIKSKERAHNLYATKKIAQALNDPTLPPDLLAKMYFKSLDNIDIRNFELIVQPLIQLFDSKRNKNSISDFYEANWKYHSNIKLLNDQLNSQLTQVQQFESGILNRIKERGDYAKSASQWLQDLSLSNSVHARHAARVLKAVAGSNNQNAVKQFPKLATVAMLLESKTGKSISLDSPPEFAADLLENRLQTLDDREFEMAVPALIEIYENDALLENVSNDFIKLLGLAIEGGMPGMTGTMSLPNSRDGLNRLYRLNILDRMQNRGKAAKAAVPWLKKISGNKGVLSRMAAKTVEAIINDLPENELSSTSESFSNSKAGGEPTFAGKTFDQWFDQVRLERDKATSQSGLDALGALAADQPDKMKKALEFVRQKMRSEGHQFEPQFDNFFKHLPAQSTVDFAINEIKSGTLASKHQIYFLLATSQLYDEEYVVKVSKVELHMNAIRENMSEIIDSLSIILNAKPKNADEFSNALNLVYGSASLVYRAHDNQSPIGGVPLFKVKLPEEIYKKLEKIALDFPDDRNLLGFQLMTLLLIPSNCDSSAVQNWLIEQLKSKRLNGYQLDRIHQEAQVTSVSQQKNWLALLTEIFKSKENCQLLIDYNNKFSNSPFGRRKPINNVLSFRLELYNWLKLIGKDTKELEDLMNSNVVKNMNGETEPADNSPK